MSDALRVQQGGCSALNVSAPMLVKVVPAPYEPARVVRVNVLVAGTAPGSVNDCAWAAQAAPANAVFVIPNAIGSYLVDFPCFAGLVVAPGAGQVVSVSYD